MDQLQQITRGFGKIDASTSTRHYYDIGRLKDATDANRIRISPPWTA